MNITIYNKIKGIALIRLLLLIVMVNGQWSMVNGQAIKIGGNVYGGGKSGDLSGSTSVTVYAGEFQDVYGGAQQANVGGASFVHIDGENASDDIFIVDVYGGNDIAGTVGQGDVQTTVPGELENIKRTDADATDKTKNAIDNSWKAFVRTSACKEKIPVQLPNVDSPLSIDARMLVVASLFGGSNGDYDYTLITEGTNEGKYRVTEKKKNTTDPEVVVAEAVDNLPEITKTYLEIKGGCIAHVYGGGNNATVTEATTINIDNTSDHLEKGAIVFKNKHPEISDVIKYFQSKVNLSTFQSRLDSWAFNHARVFGGNNKAIMHIMPKWNLQRGIIRDLYSGGNEGEMRHENGLLLEIDPSDDNKDNLTIVNVYGGCRRADVHPMIGNQDATAYSPTGYKFPKGLSARTLVRGGKITNVYGGNDISGKVYGGNAVGIYSNILGDVYGGGNGSYAYTDNANLGAMDEYKDFYYNPGSNSAEALNAFRPNAEQVSLRLAGKVETKTDEHGDEQTIVTPTIIYGSVFVGGNSATLKTNLENPMVELKIGSNVIANNVFLGDNGENMIKYEDDSDVLKICSQYVGTDGKLTDVERVGWKYNSLNFKDDATFAEYMTGCAMDLTPSVVFDNTERGDPANYEPYSTYIGSFYCGGNVGSMTSAGATTIDFTHKVIIFDKLVGGCNSAVVKATDYNARYEGGLINDNDEETGNKLILNLSGLKVQPKRWNDAGTELIWNTVDSREYNVDTKTYTPIAPVTDGTGDTPADDGKVYSTALDNARRLFGGNIYGGCCQSGIVNGNVVINLNETIVERDKLFDEVEVDEHLGEEVSLYGESQTTENTYHITKRNTGVILGQQGMDVFGAALNVFGGGKGKDTEIWGSTTINLNKGYTFQIFGGSEEGVIGKSTGTSDKSDMDYANNGDTYYPFNGKAFEFNEKYSCYVNLKGTVAGVSKSESKQDDNMADCEFMYGGGFFGPICGNTIMNIGHGRIFNCFGGSCNADILGHAEIYVGRQRLDEYKEKFAKDINDESTYVPGFPWIRDIVYGANDLGGRIFNEKSYQNRLRTTSEEKYGLNVLSMVHPTDADGKNGPDVLTASSYVEYLQGRADAIFGGCYGTYDYSDPKFKRYTWTQGEEGEENFTELGDSKLDGNNKKLFYKPRVNNAFVNFRPTYYNKYNVVKSVYGAGQGESGEKERDILQKRSYVLIDIPQVEATAEATGGTGDSESAGETVSEDFTKYADMEVFGAGAWGGVGMGVDLSGSNPNYDAASAIIDLVRGDIGAVYGGSYEEGVTRRTVVNVPANSTINIKNIFGGAYGTKILPPCDVYESHVNYWNTSEKARVTGAIYGGNNNERRTIFTEVNITSPVWSNKENGYLAKVYGAGRGVDTWAEHTVVNLESGAKVYEVYGGGEMGHVLNAESVQKYMTTYSEQPSAQISTDDSKWSDNKYWITDSNGKKFNTSYKDEWQADWKKAWTLGDGYYIPNSTFDNYAANSITNLNSVNARPEIGANTAVQLHNKTKFNTNVIINEGATVTNYAYGGGYGDTKVAMSGDVYGTTYIALLGGTVGKDIYAAGTAGSITDLFGVNPDQDPDNFIASANAYIKGGTVRNVYGGGWRGGVGHHAGLISEVANNASDIDGHVHVIIGDADGTSHLNGIPSVTRNVYGGGEGGAIYGDAHIVINKGYIGYRYNSELNDDHTTELDERYVEELDDANPGDNLLEKGGNVFGGGYVANSYVDNSIVTMYNGFVRGGLYGGGEIGPIGRGTVHPDTLNLSSVASSLVKRKNEAGQDIAIAAIYKGGSTEVSLYDGHVMRDVFGGGRGYDNWGGEGYMTDDEKLTMDRSSKGYVFGNTSVHIYGGEIGTEEGVLKGYGNVFGGGNEGFVFSATGKKVGSDRNDEHLTNGVPTDGGGFYYLDGDRTKGLTRDCYVEVAPKCRVTASDGITIGNTPYQQGQYVPVEDLNKLKNRNDATAKAQWAKLDADGVVIHNAIFAGGNITEGSDKLFANTVTVYGNAAVSLRDVFNIDLITLGNDESGGLYGDGNLTLVDGFRELHIDNYGTDYYNLDPTMEINDYNLLTDREKAYYMMKYVTGTDHLYEYYECKILHTNEGNGVIYKKGQKVTPATYNTFTVSEKANWVIGRKNYQQNEQIEETEWVLMDENEQAAWTLYGVTCYEGRPLKTIQRADMCGVFGSRMVMRGAQDRAVETVDYTEYTINRVDEVSLNKSTSAGDTHGNYFGIYNVVHYLGNLTSDVFFDDVRKTDSNIQANQPHTDGETYYQWKAANPQARNRNNGISHNKVALAAGVYLEIKREESENLDTDDWGYITGVVELDLIDVMQGLGGGYVYARNEHGVKTHHNDYGKVTMLNENESARTYRRFTYNDAVGSKQIIETSGNFVHNTKQIVDDCYPNSGMYNPNKVPYTDSPAHYWFIRGSIYIYDQYISAFTGSANAYAETVEMPLTIAAASNGRMTLREVQPNYYAYWDKNGNKLGNTSVNADERLIINNKSYYLNDPVSYWDYRLMSEADRSHFEKETYVVIEDCSVDGTSYPKGTVLTESDYNDLKGSSSYGPAVTYTEGEETKTDGNFFYFFRSSNNLSHDTGYLLTYEVNNPNVWNKYYTKTAAPVQANKLNTKQYEDLTSDKNIYTAGPTYSPKSGNNVFGQEEIKIGDIVNGTSYTNYTTNVNVGSRLTNPYRAVADGTTLTKGSTYYTSSAGAGEFIANGNEVANGTNYYIGQATVTEEAYIVTKEYSVKDASGVEEQHLNPGTPVYQSKYTPDQWAAMTGGSKPAVVKAKICKKLLEFSSTDYVYNGQLLTAEDYATIKEKVKAKNTGMTDEQAETYLTEYIDNDAYYCTKNGLYGGTYFEAGKAYRAIDTWCSISEAERANFIYNYDALDLLIDPTFSGRLGPDDPYNLYGYKPQYDGYAPESTQEAVEAGTASWLHADNTPLNPSIYSKTQPIDYQAECTKAVNYTDEKNVQQSYAVNSAQSSWLSREEYEDIPNEKRHYSPITVTEPGDYYVVKKVFMRGDIPYTLGEVIDSETYNSMTTQQKTNIDVVTFTAEHTMIEDGKYKPINYYYCREAYTINENGEGKPVKAVVANDECRYSNGTDAIEVNDVIESGYEVPAGFIIAEGATNADQYSYKSLPNFQTGNFLIHGTSPTEVSTLYVSSESDINDLSKEKIITVIYLYEYEESDESGQNVTPVSERHIVNIHINFKSGVPEIGPIDPPTIVLPGTTLGLNVPTVTEGAYRVTESGWEIFDNSSDATTHYNGDHYTNNEDPVYWYQNNYWIAYYAKTHLGKTYSNSVPVRVANYHDIKKVMDDKDHHYYIDHKDVDYEPKIYINNYSSSDENGLDLFKNLIDLTYVESKDADGNPVAISNNNNTDLNGHMPLDLSNKNKPMKGGEYLEFFLHANQDHGPTTKPNPDYDENDPESPKTITEEHPWTPIANEEGKCFEGILHGDGHTISGLDHSLFKHLCGEVYNLGVTGSFTGAGVAEDGSGYVENCWIKTSAPNTTDPDYVAETSPDPLVTGANHYAVFGNPSRTKYVAVTKGTKLTVGDKYYTSDQGGGEFTATGEETVGENQYYKERPLIQVVNSYYPESNKYYDTYPSDYSHGKATQMPDKSFFNGEVAYNLNGFYLYKRYSDKQVSAGTDYQFYTVKEDNTLSEPLTKWYNTADATDAMLCSSAASGAYKKGYVEDRFTDGDFIYAGGTIPDSDNERLYKYEENGTPKSAYYPIWPHDYIFFGQTLSYGHMDGKNGRDLRTHQEHPSYIKKSNDRILADIDGNRVYRAPAYFRSNKMGVAHFNPYAVFAAKEKLTLAEIAAHATAREVYPNMTAIDFTGSNGDLTHTYAKGSDASAPYTNITGGAFFPPLLDDDGLEKFYNADLTRNLLAYTMTTTPAATQTNNVVGGYLEDKAYTETDDDYHTVDPMSGTVDGHWVQKQGDNFVAIYDHALIDREDFNAPISYYFADGKRMWYQRMPDNYVGKLKDNAGNYRKDAGWEGVSLPFKAEIVTTNVKGEITHFYGGSWTSKNNTDSKIGHEYWLREFNGGAVSAQDNKVFEATFNYPAANSADGTKGYTNTFLWDYYYSYNDYQDQNEDKYQENDDHHDYYKRAREYDSYPRIAAAKPYIIGFPGERFYEFDLSGTFEAVTALSTPVKLEAQTITFASKPGATTIGVSDDEMGGVSENGYTFKPSYMNEVLKSVKENEATTMAKSYALNADGNAYMAVIRANDADEGTGDVSVAAFRPYFTSVAVTNPSRQTRSIVFNDMQLYDDEQSDNSIDGVLSARTGRHKIVVKSTLRASAEVRIVNTAGQTVAFFSIAPGETIETHINIGGVYIVQSDEGQFLKKMTVR